MSLRFDHCPNLRDVGLWVNELAGQPLLSTGRLFRGGQIDGLSPKELERPRTVMNLRAALLALGVPTEVVVEEYLLSTGKLQSEAFAQAMAHLAKEPPASFGRAWSRIQAKLQPLLTGP